MMDCTVQTTIPEPPEIEDIDGYGLWIHDNQLDHMEKF
ncbi:unnamed protein product, partial [marine sediment metagenome]